MPVLPEAPACPSDLTNPDGFPTVVRDLVLAALGLDPDARPSFDAICDTLRAACDVFQTELEASDARDAAEFLGSTHTPGVGGWLGDSLLMSTPRGSGGGVASGTPGSAGRVRTPGCGSGSGARSVKATAAPPPAPAGGRSGMRREGGEVAGGFVDGIASPTPRPPQARRRATAGSPAASQCSTAPADGNPEAVAPLSSAVSSSTPRRVGTSSPRAVSPHTSSGGIAVRKDGHEHCTPSHHSRRMVGSSPGGCSDQPAVLGVGTSSSSRSVTLGSPRRWAVGGLGDSGRLVSVDVGAAAFPVPALGGDWPTEL